MQPVPNTPFAPPYVPALGLRGEKPHQGVRNKNPAPYRGHNRCNFRTALGLRKGQCQNRVRSRCSGEQYDPDLGLYYLRARCYNPATGRFLSRDPENGWIKLPATLHKYLYASGDPVNRIDPSGRADLVEVDLENATIEFGDHGADHLLAKGYDLVKTQAQVEAYIEALVRQFLAEWQAAGGTVGNLFDLMFNSPILQNIPWAARVFIVSAADIRISTYFPQNIP